MLVFNDIQPVREELLGHRRNHLRIGFVPTMGALHEGHLSLIKRCKEECDVVVCSIFVNPIQFNNSKDLSNYPRNVANDLEMLQANGCDIVFTPSEREMYATVPTLTMDFGALERQMEGAFRPGHFNGVALVVSKLFHIVQPDIAYFGQKDLQQYVLIDQLVNDLSFPVSLRCEPIVRESGGLAMSSRNERLSPAERTQAEAIYASLLEGANAVQLGQESLENVSVRMMDWLAGRNIRAEYYEIVDATDLTSLKGREGLPDRVAICVAAYVGSVRLIDNIILEKE